MLRARLCLVTVLSLLATSAIAQLSAPSDSWSTLSDDYIAATFSFAPSNATQAGIHTHDAELEDFSPASIARQGAFYHQFEKRVLAFAPNSLSAIDAADREILINAIRANLLALQTVR